MSEDKLTPQQIDFLRFYTDPKSHTFSNALQSALKAGYSQDYAENITGQNPEWLSENLGDLSRLKKAEKNLDEALDLDACVIQNQKGKYTEAKDIEVIKVKVGVSQFVAKTLGKGKYSERTEHTGANGEKIPVLVEFINAKDNTDTSGVSETV